MVRAGTLGRAGGRLRQTPRAALLGRLAWCVTLWPPGPGATCARAAGDPGGVAALANLMPGAARDACLATPDAAVRTAPPVAEASRGSPGCDALPLDVIGLRVASLAVADGGSGYAAGDTITFPSCSG